jgi:hypothetical protein
MSTSDSWLLEEERLLEFSSNNNFETIPLKQLCVCFIYINHKREIVRSVKKDISLRIELNHSVLPWSSFQSEIELAFKPADDVNQYQYAFEDAALHHISIGYESIDIFEPTKLLQPIVPNKDLKIDPTLLIFHDLSELFVFMREVVPILPKRTQGVLSSASLTESSNSFLCESGVHPKSILKTGGNGKTKKVRISEEIVHIAPKKRPTRKIRFMPKNI